MSAYEVAAVLHWMANTFGVCHSVSVTELNPPAIDVISATAKGPTPIRIRSERMVNSYWLEQTIRTLTGALLGVWPRVPTWLDAARGNGTTTAPKQGVLL